MKKKTIGFELHNLAKKLWPINRSITGQGVRDTLSILKKINPKLLIYKIASGTKVYDWRIPKEWYVEDAYIINPKGKKICNFKKNNLHLVGYSTAVKKKLSLEELQKHLYSLKDKPLAIPYVTSYYKKRWGFCISHNERQKLKKGKYTAIIKSKLFNGYLNYGEIFIKGKSKKEVFLSTYICHPSMANNELSGIVVTSFLAKWLSGRKNNYSYRIVFIPETIGSIAYIKRNIKNLKDKVHAGYNITCVGDNRCYSYLPSRNGNTLSDSVAKHVLKYIYPNYKSYNWSDRGSDERQYCSPGVDLPIASIMRSKYGTYNEYHTSLDNLKNVVTPKGLENSYNTIKLALQIIDKNVTPKINFLCEPQLSKRNLYPDISFKKKDENIKLMMDLISCSDGTKTLLEIAEICNKPVWLYFPIIEKLIEKKLISTSFK